MPAPSSGAAAAAPARDLPADDLVWPDNPVVHEINTIVWLREVGDRAGAKLTLSEVPTAEWDALVPPGINVVWLMGVWDRSPAGRAIAMDNPQLRAAWSAALPDWTDTDVVGSPYCIREYVPDAALGGWDGLDVAREQLHARGALLMVDWVPNHVGPDSPWLTTEPAAFVRGTQQELAEQPDAFVAVGEHVFARGKDPYFAPWPDVVQVDAFSVTLRALAGQALAQIAQHADAVRCDMAMLMLDDVVRSTWGDRVGAAPIESYWSELIFAARSANPRFTFVAEAYWDREWDLQQLGFSHCYDKRLYDRLADGAPGPIRGHLQGDVDYQRRLARFLENHDEPRAAATFGPKAREQAYAVAIATLPGLTLWHEGQADGRATFLPVFLGRRPDDPIDPDLHAWYARVWEAAGTVRNGEWSMCSVTGWPDNTSADQLVAWTWVDDDRAALVVVNLEDRPADGVVHIDDEFLAGSDWLLTDALDGATYQHTGDELASQGLYVARPGWSTHVFVLTQVASGAEPARPEADDARKQR